MVTKNRLIKTKVLYSNIAREAATSWGMVVASWIIQDDITIKGVFLMNEHGASPGDGQTAEGSHGIALTRGAQQYDDAAILNLMSARVREATAGAHGIENFVTTKILMFPEGYGIDLDYGDVLNLFSGGSSGDNAAAAFYMSVAEIYYVER
ncbi:hypothetical protein ES705_49376 [subsurface metagenome]